MKLTKTTLSVILVLSVWLGIEVGMRALHRRVAHDRQPLADAFMLKERDLVVHVGHPELGKFDHVEFKLSYSDYFTTYSRFLYEVESGKKRYQVTVEVMKDRARLYSVMKG